MTAADANFELVDLDEQSQQQAMTLFEKNIPAVRRSLIDDGTAPATRKCLEFLVELAGRLGHAVMYCTHQWIGVVNQDERLVGAVHAGARFEEAAEMIRLLETVGPPSSPSPRWIEQFLNTVLTIDEIAVHPDYQRQGIAAALVKTLHEDFQLHVAQFAEYAQETGLRCENPTPHVVTYASTMAAQRLFAELGYTVGAPRTPVPPEYMSGMTMVFPPVHDDDGTYCYRHL